MLKRRNKKGSLQDMLFVAAVLLATGMMILLGFKFMTELNTAIQDHDMVDAQGKASTLQLKNYYPGVIDNSFLMLAIGLCIVTIILAALVRVSPIFLALYIIALTFVIFICGAMSNIYQEMAANPQLVAEAAQLVFISNVLTYLPLIVGVVGSLLAIIMYKAWSSGNL